MDPIDAPPSSPSETLPPPVGAMPLDHDGAPQPGAPVVPDDGARSEPPRLDQVLASVVDARFPMLGAGYEPASVDGFLDRLASSLQALEGETGGPAEEASADAAAALAAAEARLSSLQEQAARIEVDLDALRSDARRDAEAIRSEAERDASLLRLEARTASDAAVAAARSEAAGLVDAARQATVVADEPEPEPAAASTPLPPTAVTVAIEAIRAIADLALDEGPSSGAAGAASSDLPDPANRSLLAGSGAAQRPPAPRRSTDALSEEDAAFLAGLRRTASPTEAGGPPARGIPEAAG